MDENFIIGQDFGGTTEIHPLALGFTLFMGMLIIVLPRKSAVLALIIAGVFIPIRQRIVIASLDFYMLRILVMIGWCRILMRSEFRSIRLNAIDIVIILWAVSGIVTYTILWQTSSAFFNRMGLAFDTLGVYFLFRFFIQRLDDVNHIIKVLVAVSLLFMCCMMLERATGRNLFSIFGGVPEITVIRDGRLRCQGPFMHPILAGSFGAALMPLFIALNGQGRKSRVFMILGGIAATAITALSSSSGPILAYLAGLLAFSMWPLRRDMRVVQWSVVCCLIALQIFMNAPLYALIMRVKVIGASTGYHRYFLIDEFIKHFHEWWLFGIRYTSNWGRYLFDVTNQYIRIGVDGGIVTLGLFLLSIILAFKNIGRQIKATQYFPREQILVWGIGASLFTHLVSFMSVSYFDQIIIIWYMTLGIIASLDTIIDRVFNRAVFISSSRGTS